MDYGTKGKLGCVYDAGKVWCEMAGVDCWVTVGLGYKEVMEGHHTCACRGGQARKRAFFRLLTL